jgi:type II secretory pathway predicted ATPase ExeA
MYESFFELQRRPFAITPDPSCWFAGGPYRSVLDELVVCTERGQGVALLLAAAGMGKTLVCERLQLELRESFSVVMVRHPSRLTSEQLVPYVLRELNVPCDLSRGLETDRLLREELKNRAAAGRPLLLIVDEAHLLSEELLEELRMISDAAEQGRSLVRLVLVGQYSLEDTLALPRMSPLNQRLRAHVVCPTLTAAESRDYLDYRITWAGGRVDEIFSESAIETIIQASDGRPRCLNQLCDHALLLSYVMEQRPIFEQTIYEALEDLQHLPLAWNPVAQMRSAARSAAQTGVASSPATAHMESSAARQEISVTEPSDDDRPGGRSLFETSTSDRLDSSEERSSTARSAPVFGADTPRDWALPMVNWTATGVPAPADSEPDEEMDGIAGLESHGDFEHHGDSGHSSRVPGHDSATLTTSAIAEGHRDRSEPVDADESADGMIEQPILDKYAAIDAGMAPPPELLQQPEPTPPTVDIWDVGAVTMESGVLPDSGLSPWERVDAVNAAVDAVVGHDHWPAERSNLSASHTTPDATRPIQSLAELCPGEDGSLEEQLGVDVFRTTAEVQEHLAVELQRQLELPSRSFSPVPVWDDTVPPPSGVVETTTPVGPGSIPGRAGSTAEPTVWEVGAEMPGPASTAALHKVTETADSSSEPQGSGRGATLNDASPGQPQRLKNLFTLLRRKQQGRL